MVLAVIEDDAAKSVIDAIVDVVTRLAISHRLADHTRYGGGGGCDQETPRFGKNLNVARKETIDLRVYFSRQSAEGLDVSIVSGREAPSDIENLDFASA